MLKTGDEKNQMDHKDRSQQGVDKPLKTAPAPSSVKRKTPFMLRSRKMGPWETIPSLRSRVFLLHYLCANEELFQVGNVQIIIEHSISSFFES